MYIIFIELMCYLCVITVFISIIINDKQFLKEGQSRHWSGIILNEGGEYSVRSNILEFIGLGGNPLYSYWYTY